MLRALSLLACCPLFAQTPAFEVASVKPTPPANRGRMVLDNCRPDGSFAVAGAPLLWTIRYAFELRDYQVAGTPAWASGFDTTYDIEARSAAPAGNAECRAMLRSLLAERFQLQFHREMKEQSVLILTVAKGGHKLRENGAVRINRALQMDGPGQPTWPNGVTMAQLASLMSGWVDKPVVDRTGLAGTFWFEIEYSRGPSEPEKPSVFAAVPEQLGLRLDSGKTPIETIVIDRLARPDSN